MNNLWAESRDLWRDESLLSKEISEWASEPISKCDKQISELEKFRQNIPSKLKTVKDLEEYLKAIRRNIKEEMSNKENSLDDISLNAPNSYKLQISVPSNLNYLMKVWAAAEGRDLSSVAFQCLEIGLRTMKDKGAIPIAAIKRFDIACEKRVALAEANNIWERHEKKHIKEYFDSK